MDKETKDEFVKVRTEFSEYQKSFDKRLDELFDEIRKPLFTYPQIISAVLTMLIYTFYITKDFSLVKSMAETTKEKVEKQDIQIKENNKESSAKTDKILEIVSDIKIAVAVLEEKKTKIYSREETIEKNKGIIRNWATGNKTK